MKTQQSTTLFEWLRILRRHWIMIVLLAVVVPVALLGVSLAQTKEYSSSATLLFRDPGFDQKLFGTSVLTPSPDPTREAATNVQLVSLNAVAARTARALGYGFTTHQVRSMVSASAQGVSNLVSVTATARSPAAAARVANMFCHQYILFRQAADRAKIDQAQRLLQREIANSARSSRNTALADDLATRDEQLRTLAALQTGNAELVQPAQVPTHATSPRPVRNVIVGVVVGLLVGVVLSGVVARFDRKLRTPDEIRDMAEWPYLGIVPVDPAIATRRANSPSLSLEAIDGPLGEAFRTVRANLRFIDAGEEIQSIVVTSASPGEGKTTLAFGLAATIARTGARVLLVEADMRIPRLGSALEIPQHQGLSTILSGQASLDEVVVTLRRQQETPAAGNGASAIEGQPPEVLDIVTSGPLPPNPTELLQSKAMDNLVAEVAGKYDMLVLDTPPVGVVADAIPLFAKVSGVVVVSRIAVTSRDTFAAIRDQLEQLRVRVLGLVVNGADGPEGYGGYGYAYTYASSQQSKRAAEGRLSGA